MCSSCSSDSSFLGADELAHIAPIAQPGQMGVDELSSIAQALKTCSDELTPIAQARGNMCSSCSSHSSSRGYES